MTQPAITPGSAGNTQGRIPTSSSLAGYRTTSTVKRSFRSVPGSNGSPRTVSSRGLSTVARGPPPANGGRPRNRDAPFKKLDERKRKLVAAHFRRWENRMETFPLWSEDFIEAIRRRSDQIRKQWEEEASRGGGQRTRRNRKGRRATARCCMNAAGAYADPGALQTRESEKLLKAAGRPLLTGWKEIAQAVGNVSVRTTQRSAQKHGLPVGYVGRTAVADPEQIDEWKKRHGSAPRSSGSLFQGMRQGES
jgi:hypothetical protein